MNREEEPLLLRAVGGGRPPPKSNPMTNRHWQPGDVASTASRPHLRRSYPVYNRLLKKREKGIRRPCCEHLG